MVSEGRTFYTWRPNHTRKKKKIPEEPELPIIIITLLSVLFSGADNRHTIRALISLCVGGPEWWRYVLRARSILELVGHRGLFFILIMQIKCSLMEDNISLVTD